MRIAFVAPKWHTMVNSYPPLGLGYLASVMEEEGHSVSIHDLGLDPDTPLEEDVERIVAFAPDLIAVTAMTNNYHSAEENDLFVSRAHRLSRRRRRATCDAIPRARHV